MAPNPGLTQHSSNHDELQRGSSEFHQQPQSRSESTIAYGSSYTQKLSLFHQNHFPGQQVPDIPSSEFQEEVLEVAEDPEVAEDVEDEIDLGFYGDGVRRTLTDEQIKMFRHSEIQRLLRGRRNARRKREHDLRKREKNNQKNASRPPHFHADAAQHDAQIHILQYDDAPSDTIKIHKQGESKFLWPVLQG
jgi:Protein of unknown function (DUF3807)